MPRTSRYNVVEKFQIALTLAKKPVFDPGVQPAQDIKIIVQLRNDLIHYEPTWIEGSSSPQSRATQHKIELGTKGKFALNPLTSHNNPYYPDQCLSFGCAKWAVTRSVEFVDDFFTRIGLAIPYEHVRDRLVLS